jgi:hypothetical protein
VGDGDVFGQLWQSGLQTGRRVMLAAQTGMQAALEVMRGGGLSLADYDYGAFKYRSGRYMVFERYSNNTIYVELDSIARRDQKLYTHIRGIYNPVNRLIKLEAAKTYGGQIDWTGKLRTGAIPVEGADDQLIEAIIQVLKWSNFGTQKTPYVYQGAKYGDSFLKVIDDFERGRVRLEVLDPREVKECEFDAVGNIKRIVIEYERVEKDEKGKDHIYTYREEIDQQTFRTFKGKDPFAFYSGYYTDPITGETRLEPLDTWPNPYGFVPVRHVPHLKSTGDWGMTSFQASLSKINELNDLASITHDGVRIAVDPVWALIGGRMPENSKSSEGERDKVPVINIPIGGDIKALVTTLDIAGSMLAIDKIIGEIERDMPQLSLQRIRESGGNASGVSIENSYSDASDLLIEIQGNYDQGLIAATQMAMTIGGMRGYDAFRGITKESYEQGALDFYIKPRDVFSDRLTSDRKIELLLQASTTPVRGIVMREMGYSEDDIAEVDAGAKEKEAQQIAAGIRAAAQAAGMNPDDEDDSEDEADLIEEEIAP